MCHCYILLLFFLSVQLSCLEVAEEAAAAFEIADEEVDTVVVDLKELSGEAPDAAPELEGGAAGAPVLEEGPRDETCQFRRDCSTRQLVSVMVLSANLHPGVEVLYHIQWVCTLVSFSQELYDSLSQ